MSSAVQVEQGNFARIHNEISEQLAKTDLNGGEFRCLWFLLRKTYGFQQKEDEISYSQFAEGTGLDRRAVIRSLSNMIARKIIYQKENGNNRPQTWGFNKYFDEWLAKDDLKDNAKSEANEPEQVATVPQTSGENVTTTSDKFVTSLTATGDENVTRSSDKNDTRSSDKFVTHKRYKDKKDNIPPKSPTTGDPLMDVAMARFQNGRGLQVNGWQAEFNLDLEASKRVPLANRIAQIWGMDKSIDSGNDAANKKCHEVAIRLYRMGISCVADLDKQYTAYLSDNWRRLNYPNPKPEKLEEFVSQSRTPQVSESSSVLALSLEDIL